MHRIRLAANYRKKVKYFGIVFSTSREGLWNIRGEKFCWFGTSALVGKIWSGATFNSVDIHFKEHSEYQDDLLKSYFCEDQSVKEKEKSK